MKFKPSDKLEALGKVIAAKRAEVSTLYDQIGEADPTADQVKSVKDINKQIEAEETKYAELLEIESGKSANAARLAELKAPIRREGGGYADEDRPRGGFKSLSDEAFGSEGFKSWVGDNAKRGEGPSGKFESPKAEVKTLITGASDSSAGAFIRREYDASVPLPMRPLSIRDIITVGGTGTDLIEFVRQTLRQNNAAPVPEATATTGGSGAKPESGLAFEIVQAIVKTIATWVPATRRALADEAQIRSIIDNELRFMVAESLEREIVTGDGTGEHFLGLINTPGMTVQAYTASVLTTLRKARTKCRIQGRAIPNAYLMNPLDWEAIDLSTDGEGRYFFGGPTVLGAPRVWGVPVVEHEDMPEGRSLLGDFKVATLWDREAAQIYSSDSHADFFVRNMIAVLCELRAAFGVKRPSAIVDIDLTP